MSRRTWLGRVCVLYSIHLFSTMVAKSARHCSRSATRPLPLAGSPTGSRTAHESFHECSRSVHPALTSKWENPRKPREGVLVKALLAISVLGIAFGISLVNPPGAIAVGPTSTGIHIFAGIQSNPNIMQADAVAA